MTRRLAWLALVAACGLALALLVRGGGPRGADAKLERLVRIPDGDRRTVAAVSIAVEGRGVGWLLARSKGRWRVRELYGAYLDEPALEAWLAELLDARGLVLTPDPARAEAFGWTAGGVVRVGLHGPKVLEAEDEDRLCAIELERAAGARTLARRAGDGPLFEADRDLLQALGTLEPGALPPLVDRHLLAGSLDAGVIGFRRITLERRGAPPIVLRRVESAGEAPRWVVAEADVEQEALPWRIGGFMGLLLRGKALGFGPPADVQALGLDAPFERVVLEPDRGEPVELALSERTAANEAWLWNARSKLLLRVEGAVHAQLSPSAREFLDQELANPWEAYLQNLGRTERR